jgi:Ca-activated chloride channel family protein
MQADASQDNQTDAAKQQANASAAKTADKPAPQNPQNGAVVASSLDNQDKLPADMQRALKAVVDDPAALLRNKMQLEYQKRRQNGDIPKEQQQW